MQHAQSLRNLKGTVNQNLSKTSPLCKLRAYVSASKTTLNRPLDPGSSATFCTENLLNKLDMGGKKTNILLRTINLEEPVQAYMVNGLEVSALNENNFIALPEVYTQKSKPVDIDSIPRTEELSKWPYLSEVQILKLDAEVELLI